MNLFKRLLAGRKKSFGVLPTLASVGGVASLEKSPTLSACIRFIQSGILEAALDFESYTGRGDGWEVKPLPAKLSWVTADLYENGLVQQTADSRLQGAAVDLAIYGNALYHKLRDDQGREMALRHVPWTSVNPEIHRGVLRLFRVNGQARPLAPEDVVHIRRGCDRLNPCLGESLVLALKEPVAADIEAARYMARALNSPSPSFSISGDFDGGNSDSIKQAGEGFIAALSGEHATKVAVIPSTDIKIEHLGFSPEQMAVKELAEHPQHAICSMLGIPPQAIDVSAARSSSTYNNVSEASKKAARSCLAPLWSTIADGISDQLLEPGRERIRFRTEDVRALQEDEDTKAGRAAKLYQAGIIDRAESKRILGLDPDAADVGWYASYDRLPAPLSSSEVQAIREQVGA